MWEQVMGPLTGLLTEILNALFGAVRDYGLAIVLLTALVRVVMLPLTIKQTKSMHDLQRIQPKLKALQEKYKKDKEKMQEEMVKLYQEHKVNPLGGCLPMLIQLPIMIALFEMLRRPETFQLPTGVVHPSFYFLVPDLTSMLSKYVPLGPGLFEAIGKGALLPGAPYLVLLVLFVVTTYLPQKMMSQDPQQNRMMMIMSVMMVWIGWTIPAGVILYWVTSNVFMLIQQYVMLRVLPTEGGEGDGKK